MERTFIGGNMSNAMYIGNNRMMTRLFTSQIMYVSTKDISAMPCLTYYDIWESGCTREFLKLLKPDSVVMDLGANFGYFSVITLSKVKKGELYSFEPQHEVCEMVKDSLYTNRNETKVVVEEAAVTDKDGTIKFYPHEKFAAMASIHGGAKKGRYASKPIKVPTIGIDSYCKRMGIKKVDVMKIDTEGCEPLVFEGAKETFKKHNVKIVLEFAGQMYKDAEGFFKYMRTIFPYVYAIKPASKVQIKTWAQYLVIAPNKYCNLVLSKDPL